MKVYDLANLSKFIVNSLIINPSSFFTKSNVWKLQIKQIFEEVGE